jgi:hypothetical protein
MRQLTALIFLQVAELLAQELLLHFMAYKHGRLKQHLKQQADMFIQIQLIGITRSHLQVHLRL